MQVRWLTGALFWFARHSGYYRVVGSTMTAKTWSASSVIRIGACVWNPNGSWCYLLESICRPDAAIAKGFETTVIANDAGQVYSGIVRAEDDGFLELVQSDGQVRRIDTADIVARRTGKSAMPDDLIKQMTMRELRDLVAYLASLK